MLNIITNLENHNKNLVNIKEYSDFLDENLINYEDVEEVDFKDLITRAFIKTSRVQALREKYNKLINIPNTDKFKKLYDDAPDDIKSQILDLYCLCHMTNQWLKYKQVYKFDEDTKDMLSNNKQKITNEILANLELPYNTIAIENIFKFDDGDCDSLLINRTKSKSGIEYTFYLFYANEKERYKHQFLYYKTYGKEFEDAANECKPDIKNFYISIFNMLMYLAQPKLEVLKKKSEVKERKNNKHFYGLAVDQNEVGYKLGAAIRNYKIIYEKNENHKTGGVKKPHMRCGHFHHYWVGKGRKKLEVKYVEPMFIKGGANNIPVLHEVKK